MDSIKIKVKPFMILLYLHVLNIGPLAVECHSLSPPVKVVHLLYVTGHFFKGLNLLCSSCFIQRAYCDKRGVKTTDVAIFK